MRREIKIDVIEKMFRSSSSSRVLVYSFGLLLPKNKQRLKSCLTAIVSIVLAYFIAVSQDTISIFQNCVQDLNNIVLALFGIVFTGYALFQALIGKEMLIRMLQSTVIKKNEEISKLQESNEIFAETLMLDFICIVTNTILLMVLNVIPEKWNLLQSVVLNNILAGFGIFLYFYLELSALIEIKSFIFNIVELFNFHAGTRVLELIKKEKNKGKVQ